ncbi:hypothetical protein VTK26DRAFT_8404 [Humicola hyalothermophila]
MPNGAIISPPDSSDDDLPEVRGESRGRQIENLKELHDAISQIPQPRSRLKNSDNREDNAEPDAGDLLVLPQQANALTQGMHHSFSTGSLDELATECHRRFGHARSVTEPHITLSKSSSSSTTVSDDDSDEDRRYKPQMVRKKSGELVRPALRPASRRRPSSMPGTPTFSKAVHFDSHLEHVRHFLQVDRPLAVSAGSSPVDNYESDTEYPFSGDERSSLRSNSFEWEIVVSNFPVETPVRRAQPVHLERVWLSNDQKCLVGSVGVANLAFQKSVVCRFTLDYWKTTSEVAADYVCEIRPVETAHGQDRFQFTIKLSDLANLESKTLYFCIRYNVIGQEYWDNNGGTDFQVDFRKKPAARTGKKGASRTLSGLPKSNRRPGHPTTQTAKPAASGADEFGDRLQLNFNRSIHDYLGEPEPTGLRLKGLRSTSSLPSDTLSTDISAPSGQFSHRYDFGHSLSRAIQNAKDSMAAAKSDGLYMKSRKVPIPTAGTDTAKKTEPPVPGRPEPAATGPATKSHADSPVSSIASASYEEIVNKWCFFGTKPKSSQARSTSNAPLEASPGSPNGGSYQGSAVFMGNYQHFHSGTQHHSLHPNDPNPYFHHGIGFQTFGASPGASPLDHFSPEQTATPMGSQPRTPNTGGSPLGSTVQTNSLTGTFAPLTAIRT